MAVKKSAAPTKAASAPAAPAKAKRAAAPVAAVETEEQVVEDNVVEEVQEEDVAEASEEVVDTDAVGELNLYEAALAAVREHDPNFAVRHNKENEQVFLKRLLGTLSEVAEGIWNALPEGVQTWYNDSSLALDDGKGLPELPGFVATAVEPVKRSGVQELADTKHKKGLAKAAKGDKPEKAKRAPPVRKTPVDGGVTFPIRLAVVKNPEMNIEGLRALLEKDGHMNIKASTLSTMRGDTLATMRAMRSAGLIK